MLAKGTKVRPNEVVHLEDKTTKIFACHKGERFEILIDTADWPLVEPYSWYIEKAKKTYYASTKTGGWGTKRQRIRMHRLLLPDSYGVDHFDRNGLNNRRQNLRSATAQQNNMNQRKRAKKGDQPTSQFFGVSWDTKRGKWVAGITFNGRRQFLGRFVDDVEAAKARDKKCKELFGDFAQLNFPEEDIK